MDNKNASAESEKSVVDGQLTQGSEKKTDFWKTAFFAVLFLSIAIIGVLSLQLYKKSSSEEPKLPLIQRQPQVNEEPTPTLSEKDVCEPLSQEELIGLLPQEASMYELKHNGYNSNGCFYSINIFFPYDAYKNEKIEGDITKNQLVGCWIIGLKAKTAKRIANWPDDYGFSKWVSEEEIELMGDDDDTTSVFNVKTGEIVSRRVNQLNLRFTKGQDRLVSFKSTKQLEGCTFDKEMVQNCIQYPFDCVEKSDVTIQVDGYPDMLLKYVGKEEVKIDGKIFGDLLGEGSWRIEL